MIQDLKIMLRKLNRILKKENIIKKRIKMFNINKNKNNDIYMIIYKINKF